MAGLHESYAAVLADIRERRMRLSLEIRDLDAAITGIERIAGAAAPVPSLSPTSTSAPSLQPPPNTARGTEGDYSRISVRWAVLWHLTEFATRPEKTAEIAEAITKGGYKSDAGKFGNFVSAVLSTMKNKGEVLATEDGGFVITEAGQQTWRAIRQGAKFRDATSPNGHQPHAAQ